MYQAFIIPLFDYCDLVWTTPRLAKQVKAMERVHSKVTSTVQHLREKLSSCFFYSLVECRKFHTLVQVFRILHEMAPPYLQGLFQYSVAVAGQHSRNPSCLYVPQVRTNCGRQSLYFRGAMLWNNLPPLLYSADSIAQL